MMDARLVSVGIGRLVPITPNDTADIARTMGLYVGTEGDVAVTPADASDGTKVTIKGLGAGQIHPFMVKRVWATGTTASDILAVY